jgi:N,N-dimethylformamidase
LAYANMGGVASHDERVRQGNERLGIMGPAAAAYPQTPQDCYIVTQRLTSTYGRHSDGSGVCHASRMRPLLSMRPKYHDPFLNGGRGTPHQFNASLHLVDWLTTQGYEFDVITDDDLHHEGSIILEK